MFGSDCDPRQPVLLLSITLEKTNARIAHPNFFQPGGFLRPQTESSTNFLLIRKLHE
jgi:hypothetical protein